MAYHVSVPKFEVEYLSREPLADARIPEMIAWCRKFYEMGMTPPYAEGAHHGNMSMRAGEGCIISAARTDKSCMRPDQFVEVLSWEEAGEGFKLRCRGPATPSTDAFLHSQIFAWRPDVQVILHGHDDALLAAAPAFGLPATDRDYPSGSMALAGALEPLVRSHDFVIVTDHGFLSLGATIESAGRAAERWHERALRHRV